MYGVVAWKYLKEKYGTFDLIDATNLRKDPNMSIDIKYHFIREKVEEGTINIMVG
jgi:hypothetical protein